MMAKPTHHSELEGMGFKLADRYFNGSSDRVGTATTHHYTMTRNTVGRGNIVRPITHHVIVDEFSKSPGKYNVRYHVTQGGQPYAEGDFDTSRRHKDNIYHGSADPIRDIMEHHRGIAGAFKREQAPPLVGVTPENVHQFADRAYHAEPWGEKELSTNIVRGPAFNRVIHLNAAEVWPLDPYVHRRLTSGRHGTPTFEYEGRLSPGEDDTDVYHASYPDPDDPQGSSYGFTVRHMPGASRPFSYNATQNEVDPETGESSISRFLDVSNMGDPVLNFSKLGAVIERHHNMLRSLGLMDPRPPEKPRVYTAALSQHCPMCGSNDIDWIEDYDQDAHGLHSIPSGKYHGQCNSCYDEFKPGEDTVTTPDDEDDLYKRYMAPSHRHEDSGRPDLDRPLGERLGRTIMDQADEDLKP